MAKKRVIDVREKNEYDREHIPGAQSIPVSEMDERHKELNKDDEIVVVCNRGGQRSQKAAEILNEKGYEHVEIMEGGMSGWKAGRQDNESQ
ncbi:MAG TPA: rhodanese-like domain-containing protein [Bacillales bacterium]|nr:rhodanese-like domain-containing protein [Bacillales bacterium]